VFAPFQQGGGSQQQLCDSGLRPKVTKIKGSLSAPEAPVSLQLQQQQGHSKFPSSGLSVAAAAAGAAAVGQQQQPGGLLQAASCATDENESFTDAHEHLSGSEGGSVMSAAAAEADADQQQEPDSSMSERQQVVLPYTEAELGVMIGGTLNRQYWESIHDGAGSVRDVYSIRGPNYLRDKKKIPAGGSTWRSCEAGVRILSLCTPATWLMLHGADASVASACGHTSMRHAHHCGRS
jgi:hypothetical protein